MSQDSPRPQAVTDGRTAQAVRHSGYDDIGHYALWIDHDAGKLRKSLGQPPRLPVVVFEMQWEVV